ncbi:hypothetical protein OPQ81_011889 [Rhizoctonia solani]|nr:hypothetical protein OPQ81_002663 [Rhizoctonia solani]KAJ1300136.1 hypothetical protein OPQ81_011889 [Rhizoctonia solani]
MWSDLAYCFLSCKDHLRVSIQSIVYDFVGNLILRLYEDLDLLQTGDPEPWTIFANYLLTVVTDDILPPQPNRHGQPRSMG